jgi:hypothetical protein
MMQTFDLAFRQIHSKAVSFPIGKLAIVRKSLMKVISNNLKYELGILMIQNFCRVSIIDDPLADEPEVPFSEAQKTELIVTILNHAIEDEFVVSLRKIYNGLPGAFPQEEKALNEGAVYEPMKVQEKVDVKIVPITEKYPTFPIIAHSEATILRNPGNISNWSALVIANPILNENQEELKCFTALEMSDYIEKVDEKMGFLDKGNSIEENFHQLVDHPLKKELASLMTDQTRKERATTQRLLIHRIFYQECVEREMSKRGHDLLIPDGKFHLEVTAGKFGSDSYFPVVKIKPLDFYDNYSPIQLEIEEEYGAGLSTHEMFIRNWYEQLLSRADGTLLRRPKRLKNGRFANDGKQSVG